MKKDQDNNSCNELLAQQFIAPIVGAQFYCAHWGRIRAYACLLMLRFSLLLVAIASLLIFIITQPSGNSSAISTIMSI